MNVLITGTCSFLSLIGMAALFTGSQSKAASDAEHIPGIAVVDEKGVGQTEKEVNSGMNERVVYDQSTKTLLWNIGSEYQLVDNYTYYITFKVENGQIKAEECRLLKR